MVFSKAFCQRLLQLSLPEAVFLRCCCGVMALMTADARFVHGFFFVFFCDG